RPRTPPRAWRRSSPRLLRPRGDRALVLGLGVEGETALLEGLPGLGVARGGRVLGLERLVAAVVGRALGEVRAARRLDDAVDHPAVDAQRQERTLAQQVLARDDALAGDEAALRRAEQDVVEVEVGAEELRVAARVGSVHVHDREVDGDRGHREELLAVL